MVSDNLDPNGTVSNVIVDAGGSRFYNPEIKIRPILKSVTNGVPAVLEADLYGGDLLHRIIGHIGTKQTMLGEYMLRNGGKGYAYPPKIRIIGDGFGAEALASVDLDPASSTFGEITSVTVTDFGMNYTETPIVEVYGGFGFGSGALEANTTSQVTINYSMLTFMQMVFSSIRVKTKPYHTVWYPGQEGIHEVYSVGRDDKGNRYTSEPQFSIQHVDGPEGEIDLSYWGFVFQFQVWKRRVAYLYCETDPGQ